MALLAATRTKCRTPDPHEEFEHVTQQIFGKSDPNANDQANMSGFLQNYFTTKAGIESCGQIMQDLWSGGTPM
jgi:hypothetical protein